MLRDGRPALPAKITSSISEPRTDVGRVSPITQRSASNRLDFPHPFGPTIAVSPGSMRSSVGSMNDLKPESLSLLNLNWNAPPYAFSSFLRQECIQRGLERRPGNVTWLLGDTIDDQSGSRIDVVPLRRLFRDLVDSLRIRLVRHAGICLRLIHSCSDGSDLHESRMHVRRIIFRIPVFLIPEDHVNKVEIAIPSARAARQPFGGAICFAIDREYAKYVVDLALIDVVGPDVLKGFCVEARTDRTGGRAIFDHHHWRLGRADGFVVGTERVAGFRWVGAGRAVGRRVEKGKVGHHRKNHSTGGYAENGQLSAR